VLIICALKTVGDNWTEFQAVMKNIFQKNQKRGWN
jgi:hypothetical protein